MAKKQKKARTAGNRISAAAPKAKKTVTSKPAPKRPAGRWVIRGRIVGAKQGQVVRAYDQDLRSEELLGEALTDSKGNYEIRYEPKKFQHAENKGPDVRVAVCQRGGQELVSSATFFNAGREQVIDLELPAGSLPPPSHSEYERYLGSITPLLQGLALADLVDKDITFLAGDTAIERQRISWLVRAAEWEKKSRHIDPAIRTRVSDFVLPAAVFYGWFRSGLPENWSELWTISVDRLFSALETAVAQYVVPAKLTLDAAALRARVEQVKLDALLQAPGVGPTASLGGLLATLPVPPSLGQQRVLAAALPELRTEDPQLVERIAKLPGFDGDAVGVARTLRLDALTAGHVPLTRALQVHLTEEREGELRPLAALQPEEWIDLAYTHGTPPGETIAPDAYARSLAAKVEEQHPTASLAAHLVEGRPLGGQPVLAGVGEFLRNNPGFDITTGNIEALTPEAKFDGTDPAKVTEGLRVLQRMNRIEARWEETAVLMENGISSPQHVLDAGPGQLTATLEGSLSPERIVELHDRAEDLYATTLAGFTAALSPFSGPSVMQGRFSFIPPGDYPNPDDPPLGGGVTVDPRIDGILNPHEITELPPKLGITPRGGPPKGAVEVPVEHDDHHVPDFIKDVIVHQPTLQSVFGAQDGCACAHCSSVLSPAAYFVDVLHFIKNAGMLGEIEGNGGLFARRPDLKDLELSCDNTNTEVPSIDLVLEILENAVALPLDVPLPAGTDIEAQLRGTAVGAAVRTALQKTVRSLVGTVQATAAGLHEVGTTDWTVVDGHRRWSLTVQKKVFRAEMETGAVRLLNVTGLDQAALVKSLNGGQISPAGETAFAELFARTPTRPLEYGNYAVTTAPLLPGKSWQITYGFVAEVVIDATGSRLILQTTAGTIWSNRIFHPDAIAAAAADLAQGIVPELVRALVASKFSEMRALKVASSGTNRWTLSGPVRGLVLGFTPAALTITSLTYQSGDTAVDAVAWPENHNPEAYARLKGASFPWSLPVDLPLEQVRLFLERARSSRRRLMEVRMPIQSLAGNDPAFAAEVLGLSDAEEKLIALSPTTPEGIYACWGLSLDRKALWDAAAGKEFTAASPLGLLQNVSILLQQSRLDFATLPAVLQTRFVSSATTGTLRIEPPDTCVPSDMKLIGLMAAHLDRIHRFVRLQRRLGWTISDLDRAIQAAPGATLDATTLRWLAGVVRLHELLQLPVASILEWWPVSGAAANPDRARGLARALDLTLGDLEHAGFLFGTADLFSHPSETFRFCERITAVQRGDISFEDLRYVLHQTSAPEAAAFLDQGSQTQLLTIAWQAVQSVPGIAAARSAAVPTESEQATITLAADAAIAALASRLNASRELVEELLRVRLRHPLHPADIKQAAIDVFLETASAVQLPALGGALQSVLVRLHKAVFVCNALGLGQAQLRWLQKPAALADGSGLIALDFDLLPAIAGDGPADVTGYERLIATVQLRKSAARASDLVRQYAAVDFTATNYAAEARRILRVGLVLSEVTEAAAVSQADEQVEKAATQLQITTAAHYRDPLVLLRFIGFLTALKQLGATVDQATDFTRPSPDDAVAVAARELLRKKYSAASWHDLIKPIADTLRERQRDALVDFLIARDNLRQDPPRPAGVVAPRRFRDVNDLYEFYLIDVQTSSCLKTTRMLQATAAAQLYVQRLLLNLEGKVSLSADKRQLWDWMHRYRVWEANRKVFLFPENWLLPDLRDDKTAIFRAMEGIVTEGEPSLERTREALLGYLENLGELAQIGVIAMYEDRRNLGKDSHGQDVIDTTLHVVGRTPNQPYRYFWRTAAHFGQGNMSWTGWEALDLDNANDFIMPFVFEGDLHVAWPLFRKAVDEADERNLLWEVQIAWSRRSGNRWVKRKLGHDVLRVERLFALTELSSFVFQLRKTWAPIPLAQNLTAETVVIDCYAATEEKSTYDPLLARKNALPDHGTFIAPGGITGWWNVYLTVSGKLSRHYEVQNGSDKVQIYHPVNAGLVTLDYTETDNVNFFQNNDRHASRFTGPQGTFNFGTIKVQNGGRVTLTFYRNDGSKAETQSVDLFATTNNPGDKILYQNWTWEVTHIFEVAKPKQTDVDANREVKLKQAAGSFVLESARDLQIRGSTSVLEDPVGAERFGNRFVRRSGGSVVRLMAAGDISLDHEVGSSFFLTPATRPEGGTAETWYLQEGNSGCYVQRSGNKWKPWPDGQVFVGDYRRIGSASTFALFDPVIQAMSRNPATNAPAPAGTAVGTMAPAISFDRATPYANYNWELFLHLPLAMADHLAAQQRFAEARQWLHAVFDPTTQVEKNHVLQFWRFLPFRNDRVPASIAKLLTWLANPAQVDPQFAAEQAADEAIGVGLKTQIQEWKNNPFMPHVVARLRPSAYEWHTFFAYLDILINWGDQQFRRDTRESVNEATLLYVLAAKLLGPRPRAISPVVPTPPQTFRSLGTLDDFSNSWVTYSDLPGVKKLVSNQQAATAASKTGQASAKKSMHEKPPKTGIQTLASLGSLAFCVPQNEKLTEFYDRLEQRLFNVRHCRNIDGVERELPLFDPPIDPLLLIKAKAAGLDLNSELAGAYAAPLPHYRFTFTLQKAIELTAELKALGGALLGAMEKQDAEELTLLRSRHEIAMLKLARDVRQRQVDEAEANIAGLRQSEEGILERFGQYQKLLGKTNLTKGQDDLPVVEQSSSLAVSTDTNGGVSGLGLIRKEVDQLSLASDANNITQAVNAGYVMAGVLSIFPNIWAGAITAGQTFGGANLGNAASAIAKGMEMAATQASFSANRQGTLGSYERRQDDWIHQSKLALAELKQVEKQIVAAQIRKEIAELELRNHDTQIENAEAVDEFMRGKFSSRELYRWMASKIAEVYFRMYQLALDQARRAERAYRYELGLDGKTPPFVQPGYWDSLKKGLLAGEQLHHDLKRMEVAHQNQNQREFEITKHISLLQLDPVALMTLRETQTCTLQIPEALFDLDFPGHYLRRIKLVSLTVPCVVGPYSSVSCTLTLTKSETRQKATDPTLTVDAPRAANSAIVTSTGQNDSGMFEANMRDERYLPFEGAGVVSTWQLDLPSAFPAFDYNTIADVVLHFRYTARDGGSTLAQNAKAGLQAAVNAIENATKGTSLARLFSLRHEYPTEWHRLTAVPVGTTDNSVDLTIAKNRFPFLFAQKNITIVKIELCARLKPEVENPEFPAGLKLTLPDGTVAQIEALVTTLGPRLLSKTITKKNTTGDPLKLEIEAKEESANWNFALDHTAAADFRDSTEDILLVCHYQLAPPS